MLDLESIKVGSVIKFLSPELINKSLKISYPTLLNDIRLVFNLLSSIENKGFINNPTIDIPLTSWLIQRIPKSDRGDGKDLTNGFSVGCNVLSYNLIIIMLYRLLLELDELVKEGLKRGELEVYEDFLTDINTQLKEIEKMIHPYIKKILAKGGVIATMNIYAGFDSEYVALSTLNKTNSLLSIQLAVNVGLTIRLKQPPFSKVLYDSITSISCKDLDVVEKTYKSEDRITDILEDSLIKNVVEIRKMQCLDHDEVIKLLINNLDANKSIVRNVNNDFISYNLPKSKVKTFIKYTDTYKSDELINKIDEMGDQYINENAIYLANLLSMIRLVNTDQANDKELVGKEVKVVKDVKDVKEEEEEEVKEVKEVKEEVEAAEKEEEEEVAAPELATDEVEELEEGSAEEEVVLLGKLKASLSKPSSRIGIRYNLSGKLNISTYRIIYIVTHESAADLSMLSDFDNLKTTLDLVHGCFITVGKALVDVNWKSRVHFRDTKLLAPASASKSLANIGKIYGQEYHKKDIAPYRQDDMRELLEKDRVLFEEYAIQDSLITLKHANSMEEFGFKYGVKGVPLTLSSIGRSYIKYTWEKEKYDGYQLKSKLISLADIKITPKGLRSYNVVKHMSLFLASYRGGRNETFMYGVEYLKGGRVFIDYDLTSCYTTVMSILGDPDYDNVKRMSKEELDAQDNEFFITNYLVIDVMFEYVDKNLYPGIPTTVSDEIDIYPLAGSSVITGGEYLVAKTRGCKLNVKDCILVPFKPLKKKKKNDDDDGSEQEPKTMLDHIGGYYTPFRGAMKDIQGLRRKYNKGTFENLMYKEIGNSVYGQTSMGLSGKKTLDSKTNTMVVVKGNILSNPLIASYITGFTRALISECLDNISKLGGKVVSVTTDGFITDIEDLETKILSLDPQFTTCLRAYGAIREVLTIETKNGIESFNNKALEIKHEERVGLISWKTRGQIGMGSGIAAATGFQRYNYETDFLVGELTRILKTDRKNVEFIQSSLRRGNELYKEGGHVQMVYKDRKFSLIYDNKRRIVEGGGSSSSRKRSLLSSIPWEDVDVMKRIRFLTKSSKTPVYHPNYITSDSKTYRSHIETSVRSFIKIALNEPIKYGLPKENFKTYKSLLAFIYGHQPALEVKLNVNNISRLKNRDTISRAVPRTSENECFVQYVKAEFPSFNDDLFFKELTTEKIRELKSSKTKQRSKKS